MAQTQEGVCEFQVSNEKNDWKYNIDFRKRKWNRDILCFLEMGGNKAIIEAIQNKLVGFP